MVNRVLSSREARHETRSARRDVCAQRVARRTPARAGNNWNAAEDEKLARELEQGVSFADICEAHQRSPRDVRARLAELQPWARRSAPTPRAHARWSAREEARLARLSRPARLF